MKLSETTAEVIALATAIGDYWDTELPKRHPNYPFISPTEDSGPPPPEEKKLKDLLTSLSADDVYKLTLLMYVGRGDFGTDDLAKHFGMLKKRFANPDNAIAQMMGKASLADYLTDGLAELEKSGIDLDLLTFASVSSGS
jgi:Protein of unknown function (DUF3775)